MYSQAKFRAVASSTNHKPSSTIKTGVNKRSVTQNTIERLVLSLPFTDGSIGMAASLYSSLDRKSTRLNSSHVAISYAVFCSKKKSERPSAGGAAQRAGVRS